MKKALLLAVTLPIILICAESASACVCSTASTDTEVGFRLAVAGALSTSAAVFSGEVVEVGRRDVRFKVLETWKGADGEELTLFPVESTCPYRFEVGKTYLVFARMFKRGLTAEQCSFTSPLAEGGRFADELDRLGLVGVGLPFGSFLTRNKNGIEGTVWRLECKANCPQTGGVASRPIVIQFLARGTVRLAFEFDGERYKERPCYSEVVDAERVPSWAGSGDDFVVTFPNPRVSLNGKATGRRMSTTFRQGDREAQVWEGKEVPAGKSYPPCIIE